MTEIEEMHKRIGAEMLELADEYRCTGNPFDQRIRSYLDGVLSAPSAVEAQVKGREAIKKFETHLLFLWAKKKIPGPKKFEAPAEELAKKAENLADMLEKKGEPNKADAQRERAKKLREKKDG